MAAAGHRMLSVRLQMGVLYPAVVKKAVTKMATEARASWKANLRSLPPTHILLPGSQPALQAARWGTRPEATCQAAPQNWQQHLTACDVLLTYCRPQDACPAGQGTPVPAGPCQPTGTVHRHTIHDLPDGCLFTSKSSWPAAMADDRFITQTMQTLHHQLPGRGCHCLGQACCANPTCANSKATALGPY